MMTFQGELCHFQRRGRGGSGTLSRGEGLTPFQVRSFQKSGGGGGVVHFPRGQQDIFQEGILQGGETVDFLRVEDNALPLNSFYRGGGGGGLTQK